MKSVLIFVLAGFLSGIAIAQAPQGPDQLVQGITTEVIGIIKKDKEIQSGNSKRIQDLVEGRVLPHFSFTRMTQIAMAVNWRRASPEQQQALVLVQVNATPIHCLSTKCSSLAEQGGFGRDGGVLMNKFFLLLFVHKKKIFLEVY